MIDMQRQEGQGQQAGLQSLIAIVDERAVPFCHYDNPKFRRGRPRWMAIEVLKKTVRFAQERRLRLLCLLGASALPKSHAAILRESGCAYMAPLAVCARMEGAIPVLEAKDAAAASRRRGGPIENGILRLGRKDMRRLGEILGKLAGKFKRLNVCLLELGEYGEEDFEAYRGQLELVAGAVAGSQWPGGTECNLVTDRPMLGAMNNCDAGVKHITVCPQGRFYLCPGFYYWREAQDAGDLDRGLVIESPHLLTVEYAPICRRCDAFHCRRCLLLNKQLTEEINTPSRQQCVAAHIEREQSRRLLNLLGEAGRLKEAMPGTIPTLDYLEPFEVILKALREMKGSKK